MTVVVDVFGGPGGASLGLQHLGLHPVGIEWDAAACATRAAAGHHTILQGFPPDYPWQGTRSKRWEQIGNAVPPRLAQVCVNQLLTEENHR